MRNDTGVLTGLAGEALARHRLVKADGTTSTGIVYADAGDSPLGGTVQAVESGKTGRYWSLRSKEGTITCTASGAVTIHALVYADQDGKVTSNAHGAPIGRALQAATADGDWIEVLPGVHPRYGDLTSTHGLFDDFLYYVSTDLWTTVASDSGTAAVSDAAGGELLLSPSDGSVGDNDETYVSQTTETFLFAANKPIYFEARVKITEANTDDANVMVGLADAWAADTLQDDGAGPKASGSHAVFYKIDGGTTWLAQVSIGATQTSVTLTATTATTATYFKLGIEVIPTSATVATVNFYIDDTLVGSTATFTYTGATEMEAGVGVKNGSANHDKLTVDYILCRQVR